MADDEIKHDTATTTFLDPAPHVDHEPEEPASAVTRLRAFEDEKLGDDAPRFAGKLERGSGSLYARLSPEDQAMHAKLEHLVVIEQKLADAHAALIATDAEYEAALSAVGG